MVKISLGCRKWTSFGFCTVFLFVGLILVFWWTCIYASIMHGQLALVNGSEQYQNWLETPIEVNFQVFLFNWTNVEEFEKNKGVKPKFEQVGPYTFNEHHTRTNVKFNDNYTVSFNTIRNWMFKPEESRPLEDNITIINPIALAVANVVRTRHHLIKRGTHYFFVESNITSLAQTKTAREFLFDGFDDILIDVALKLKIKGYEVPYEKFAWFYGRNGSSSFDGDYVMWTGEDDIRKTGIVTVWNHSTISHAYEGECDRIDGSTGEVWYPPRQDEYVSMFISDLCSKITLEKTGTKTVNGIEGSIYEATEKLFDNGVKYPETACFNPGVRLPSGTRNISECQYKAPAFLSLPHFYLADESYRNNVIGMNPDPAKHKLYFVIQPDLGLPLEVQASFQANMMMYQVEELDILKNVSDTMVPMIWVSVKAGIPDNMITKVKFAIAVPTIGTCLGYALIVIGFCCLIYTIVIDNKIRTLEAKQSRFAFFKSWRK